MAADTRIKLGVHPVADLFPMLNDEELNELAADIKERGQLHPIVLDAEGRILDGRNRHAACVLADVEPAFTTYEGPDPDGYALAVNIVRRSLSIGAKAIITAQAARRNGTKGKDAAKMLSDNISAAGRISDANMVLDWSANGDLAAGVIAGEPLAVAVRTARERKQAAKIRDEKLTRLRADANDLAELVAESRMGVDDAINALNGRIEAARREAAEAERKQQEATEAEAERRRQAEAEEAERIRREADEEARIALELAREQRVHVNSVSGIFRAAVATFTQAFSHPTTQAELVKIYDQSAGDAPPFPVDLASLDKLVASATAIRDLWKEHRS